MTTLVGVAILGLLAYYLFSSEEQNAVLAHDVDSSGHVRSGGLDTDNSTVHRPRVRRRRAKIVPIRAVRSEIIDNGDEMVSIGDIDVNAEEESA